MTASRALARASLRCVSPSRGLALRVAARPVRGAVRPVPRRAALSRSPAPSPLPSPSPRCYHHRAFTTSSTHCKSSLRTVPASPDAPREAPVPVVLLTASHLNANTGEDRLSPYMYELSARGYECLVVNVYPDEVPRDDSSAMLSALEDDLTATLRGASPFPPILIAHGLSCLLAEQYISSHPVSALLMLDPPTSNAAAHQEHKSLLPTAFPEFDYEPMFPVNVAWTSGDEGALSSGALHRVEAALLDEGDGAPQRLMLAADPHKAVAQMLEWLEDECGVLDRDDVEDEEGHDEGDAHETFGDEDAEDDVHADVDATHKPLLAYGTTPPSWFDPSLYTFQRGNKKLPLLIPPQHIREAFSRGGGKGGQAINKNMSRCDLTHTPTSLLVRCQKTRSLEQNRVIAQRRLARLVDWHLRGEESAMGQEAAVRRRKKERAAKAARRRARDRRDEHKEGDGEASSMPPPPQLGAKQKRAMRQQAKEEKARQREESRRGKQQQKR